MPTQETGDRATYLYSRLMESELSKEETYAIAREELGKQGTSFAQEKAPVQNDFSRNLGRRNQKDTIEWGRRIPMGDCGAQEVTIGEFPFVAIDFGDTFRASEQIRKETYNVENREANQCALLHLVAGAQWARTKRQQRIPEFQKVFLDAEEWRCEEIRQAKLESEWCVNRGDQMAQEWGSLAHEATTAGHDRDYRIITVFFHELLRHHQLNFRVFVLGSRGAGGYELRVIYFHVTGGESWPIVDLLAFRHHMRWLKTGPGILASSKSDWGGRCFRTICRSSM